LRRFFTDADSGSSSSDVEDFCEAESLVSVLRGWYIDSRSNLNQLGLLLEALRPFHSDLLRDPRTVAKTPRSTPAIELRNGSYVHLGLKEGLLSRCQSGLRDPTAIVLSV